MLHDAFHETSEKKQRGKIEKILIWNGTLFSWAKRANSADPVDILQPFMIEINKQDLRLDIMESGFEETFFVRLVAIKVFAERLLELAWIC